MPGFERTYTLAQAPAVAVELLAHFAEQKLWVFSGDLGAGKTTLIRALCQQLGVAEQAVTSPSFAIVNEYAGTSGPVYHFDFYRLRRPEEALDLGLYEYLDSSHYCLMEWPEQVTGLLPADVVQVVLGATPHPDQRLLTAR
jgi:tRNA threonylcarbamoyladenosine biosynthesis protein TsaE